MLTRLTICSLRILTICNLSFFPFGIEGLSLDLIASVPGFCILFPVLVLIASVHALCILFTLLHFL